MLEIKRTIFLTQTPFRIVRTNEMFSSEMEIQSAKGLHIRELNSSPATVFSEKQKLKKIMILIS